MREGLGGEVDSESRIKKRSDDEVRYDNNTDLVSCTVAYFV
jgi:hypothetical protein